jgi:hypothetical protein
MSGEVSFEPDESVQRMAERAAGMIVDAAPKIFDVTLYQRRLRVKPIGGRYAPPAFGAMGGRPR